MGEWMWLWYETYSKPNIRATTQDNYENYIRNYIEPRLGHYSTGFTLDTYTHVTDQMQKAAAQRMQGVMNAALPNEQPDPPQDNACKVIEFKKAMNT